MIEEQPKIKILDSGNNTLTAEDLKKDTDIKFKDVNYILLTVVVILLVMVATLVIDSFHFNSVTYNEYSQKTESVETTQKTNEALFKQIQVLSEQNNKYQDILFEQQKQIQQLFQKNL